MFEKALKRIAFALLFAPAILIPSLSFAQVTVIDMIPNNMSDETNFDKEPFLSINYATPLTMAATAFMPTPAMLNNGPMLVSFDGGNTWVARNIIPSSPGSFFNTGDITIRFNTSGTALYAGYLRQGGAGGLEISRTTDMANLNTPLTLLNTPRSTDQPYISARTVTGWFDSGLDRLWVGNNDGANSPKSATVDQTLDAGAMMPTFSQIRVDQDTPVGRDNYQCRTTANADGHIYNAFYRRKGSIMGGYNADVVVTRDDNWGKGMTPFSILVDSITMAPGENVAAGTTVSDTFGSSTALGSDWWGGDLYLVVDPNDASIVYISYSDENGGARTLHLRRSADWGQTWQPDLLTINGAKNAAIAINSHGRIAYLYQQLTGTAPNLTWSTHLRRSNDGTMWNDFTLATFTMNGTDPPAGSRIIGDYEQMIAVGKNFYGVFTSWNSLTNATFPQGVTFQRNKTPNGAMNPTFLGNDNVTPVHSSMDPFFFRTNEMDADKDYYVRDWTDTATAHDSGQEPSVRSDFYSTSDVWNRRTDDPQPFDGNDRPQSQDPQPAAMGHNFAFARVTREANGTPADVSLQYLYSDGGVGVPYVSAGPPKKLHFAVPNKVKTPGAGSGYQWDLPSGASNHVCLAIEISTGTDPIISPSLLGHAPGWPTTDLMVVADNNKAQRNMQVFGYGGMSESSDGSLMSMYAIVHNAATRWRDVQIGIGGDPRELRSFQRTSLRVAGSAGQETGTIKPGDVLTLPKMAPGENRWLELSFMPRAGARVSARVDLLELVNGIPVNGYGIAPTSMKIEDAIRETLIQHVAVFTRLYAAFGVDGANRQAANARELLDSKTLTSAAYAKFIMTESRALSAIVQSFVHGYDDPFGVIAAVKALSSVSNATIMQANHLTLLNKLDAAQTMRQKAAGDAADIPQNVRWQRELFLALRTPHSKEVDEESRRFLMDFEQQKVGIDAFGPLLTRLRDALKEGAARDASGEALKRLDALTGARSPAALQNVHRRFLVALAKTIQSDSPR